MPVVITEKNLLVLQTLAKYYVLSRSMIQEMCFPHVKSSRSVCERLRKLKRYGYISQATMEVVLAGQNATPVYFPNKKTAQTLADAFGNSDYENVFCRPPSGRLLFHWLEISRTHWQVNQASKVESLSLHDWFNEWEPINKSEPKASKRFSLVTDFGKSSCAPDAGFLIENRSGAKKVFYVEVDRGTDSIRRIVSKKPNGYAKMYERDIHAQHFRDKTVADFSVLFITTTEYRRDALTQKANSFKRNELWKFACRKDLSPDTFFSESVWHSANEEPHSLVQR
ncbi:MAG: replication-relaxation family protein [Planctomycetota bacterium]